MDDGVKQEVGLESHNLSLWDLFYLTPIMALLPSALLRTNWFGGAGKRMRKTTPDGGNSDVINATDTLTQGQASSLRLDPESQKGWLISRPCQKAPFQTFGPGHRD